MDKTFWVIETARQTYWTGRAIKNDANFSPDITEATKFADHESAEKVRCWLLETREGEQRLRSAEHSYLQSETA